MDRISPKYGVMPPKVPQCTHNEECPLDAKGMKGHRHRNKNGKLREKSGSTHLSTIEDQYGEVSSMPGPTHLKKLREVTGERGIKKVRKALKKKY